MRVCGWATLLASFALAGCDGDDDALMTGPGAMRRGGGPALLTVAPAGVAVSVGEHIHLRFTQPMALGMEQWVDLHEGDVAGPVVPMSCAWSSDRLALTCTLDAPLRPRTVYAIHVGGGLRDINGRPVDLSLYGPHLGGGWVTAGMMGRGHGGVPWSMMGPGWAHASGAYGMVFTFTTA